MPKNLRICRDKTGLSQRELAKLLKIAPSTLAMYETGRRAPDYATLERMANFFGVSVDYLLDRDERKLDLLHVLEDANTEITAGDKSLSREQRLAVLRALDGAPAVPGPEIPVLGRIKAGIPLLSEQNITGYLEVPSDLAGYVDFALKVVGDSMIGAGISEGDIVLCKEDKNPYPGQIVIVLLNNYETTLKFFVKENGQPYLRAANPNYQDIALRPGDQIQGRVVRVWKDAPTLNAYREYIYLSEETKLEWNDVIEKAIANGVKPSALREIINMQLEFAKRLAGK
ncbi:helix-turn-helix domain-containing protein [Desulfotruncus alcoholivorax]|uniref:helix-turn-helix domain-containing protein n=1 Tax=Desulfotruncus alcoholivorax TaxID=265477 RepID=UPI00146FC448|nr:LexA family transcriptional regulator [Desulfotruncus alcoholivorax]